MQKNIKILLAFTIIQVVLVVVLWSSTGRLQGYQAGNKMLAFKPEEIDKILIKSPQQSVQLQKKEKKWQLDNGFAANQTQITNLLLKLSTLKYHLPVATSKQALTRFKVAEQKFERQVQLFKGDKTLATLYLGSGAGARQTYARNADQQAVYRVPLGAYELGDKPAYWLDKTILQFPADALKHISLASYQFSRIKDKQSDTSQDQAKAAKSSDNTLTKWQIQPLPKDKTLDQDKFADALEKLSRLRISDIDKDTKVSKLLDAKPVLQMDIELADKKRNYLLFKPEKEADHYLLKVSDYPQYFQLDKFVAEDLIDAFTPDNWLASKKQT